MLDFAEAIIKAVKNGAESAKETIKKSWKAMLLDSAIVAGISFVAQLPDTIPCIGDLYLPAKVFAATFILQVAIERGLKKGKTE